MKKCKEKKRERDKERGREREERMEQEKKQSRKRQVGGGESRIGKMHNGGERKKRGEGRKWSRR